MLNSITKSLALIAVGAMLCGSVVAQQTAPPHPAPVPSAQGKTAPTAKPHPATAAKTPSALTLKTQREKASYAIGLNIGKNLHRDSVDVDPNILARGIKDALAGSKPLLTDDEMREAMTALQSDVRT